MGKVYKLRDDRDFVDIWRKLQNNELEKDDKVEILSPKVDILLPYYSSIIKELLIKDCVSSISVSITSSIITLNNSDKRSFLEITEGLERAKNLQMLKLSSTEEREYMQYTMNSITKDHKLKEISLDLRNLSEFMQKNLIRTLDDNVHILRCDLGIKGNEYSELNAEIRKITQRNNMLEAFKEGDLDRRFLLNTPEVEDIIKGIKQNHFISLDISEDNWRKLLSNDLFVEKFDKIIPEKYNKLKEELQGVRDNLKKLRSDCESLIRKDNFEPKQLTELGLDHAKLFDLVLDIRYQHHDDEPLLNKVDSSLRYIEAAAVIENLNKENGMTPDKLMDKAITRYVRPFGKFSSSSVVEIYYSKEEIKEFFKRQFEGKSEKEKAELVNKYKNCSVPNIMYEVAKESYNKNSEDLESNLKIAENLAKIEKDQGLEKVFDGEGKVLHILHLQIIDQANAEFHKIFSEHKVKLNKEDYFEVDRSSLEEFGKMPNIIRDTTFIQLAKDVEKHAQDKNYAVLNVLLYFTAVSRFNEIKSAKPSLDVKSKEFKTLVIKDALAFRYYSQEEINGFFHEEFNNLSDKDFKGKFDEYNKYPHLTKIIDNTAGKRYENVIKEQEELNGQREREQNKAKTPTSELTDEKITELAGKILDAAIGKKFASKEMRKNLSDSIVSNLKEFAKDSENKIALYELGNNPNHQDELFNQLKQATEGKMLKNVRPKEILTLISNTIERVLNLIKISLGFKEKNLGQLVQGSVKLNKEINKKTDFYSAIKPPQDGRGR